MSHQLCLVQSLIDRTINSDSLSSLTFKLKERVICLTRSFNNIIGQRFITKWPKNFRF